MAIAYYDDPDYWERLDGRDYPKVSPKTTHSLVQVAMASRFRDLARGHALVMTELRCRVGAQDGTDSHLQPDISVIAIDRWRALQSDAEKEEPPFSPDIAVEIRSPGQKPRLRMRKIERYLATGAKLVLDVIPAERRVDAYSEAGRATFVVGQHLRSEHFAWLDFAIAEAFEDLDAE